MGERLRAQNVALSQSVESYKKQFEATNEQLLLYKSRWIDSEQKNKALNRRLEALQNQLVGTRNIAINGSGPRLDNLQFVKYEMDETEMNENGDGPSINYKHTLGVDKLKQSVRAKYDTSKWKIEGDEDLYDYFDSILSFLNENEENVVLPQVLIMDEEVMEDDDEENYSLYLQTDVMEKYMIESYDRVPSLNGQFGIRAKMDIPRHTVVGQYIGVEYLEEEFHSAFSGTQENALKNIYAFTLSVGDNPTTTKKEEKLQKIVIDAHGFEVDANGDKPLLIFINDCRKDISMENKTSDDQQIENVLFAKVSLNGWPSIFVITKREIKKNEQLMGFYGNDYFHAVKEKQLQENIRQRNRNIIDHNILRGNQLNNNSVNLV